MQIIRTTILSLLCLCFLSGQSQDTLYFPSESAVDTTSAIHVISKYSGDSVVIRWAPTVASDWLELNKSGYRVLRYQLDKGGLPIAGSLQEHKVNPWDAERLRGQLDTGSDYLLAAAQCLYGAWESTQTGALNMHGRYQELQNRFGIALLSADLDVTAADALGLRFIDRTAGDSLLYLYQVFPADTAIQIAAGY
jgi:hypothetical protein